MAPERTQWRALRAHGDPVPSVVVSSLKETALARGIMDFGPVVTKSFSGIDVFDH